MKKRRFLAVLLSFCMLSGSMPVMAAEPENGNYESSNDDSTYNDFSSEDGQNASNTQTMILDEINSEENKDAETAGESVESSETDIEPEEPVLEEQDEESLNVEEQDEEPLNGEEAAVASLVCGVNTITMTNDSYEDQRCQWYSFTAPEDGCFNFYPESMDGIFSISLYEEVNKGIINIINNQNLNTGYMESGDTVYLGLYVDTMVDTSVSITIQKISSYSSQKQDDGSYTFDTYDYTLSVLPEIENEQVNVNVSMEAKQEKALVDGYFWCAHWNNADSDDEFSKNIADISLNEDNNYRGKISFTAETDKEYELQLLLYDADGYVSTVLFVDELFINENDAADEIETVYNEEIQDIEIPDEEVLDEEIPDAEVDAYFPDDGEYVAFTTNEYDAFETSETEVEKDEIKVRATTNITVEGKAFGITGITTDSAYPAIKEEDGSYTLAYKAGGDILYTAKAEVSPIQEDCSPSDFTWSSSNNTIAEISSYGVITPKKAGSVVLTLKPRKYYTIDNKPYDVNEVKITLNIKNLPSNISSTLDALANVKTKIGDVDFPESWGESWSWKYPDTPLVTNGVYDDNSYLFEAVYTGTEYYPCETAVSVRIGNITGVDVAESISSGSSGHNQVLEVGTDDVLTLNVSPIKQGQISASDYSVAIPDVSGLIITNNGNGNFSIKAQKKGSYTLKPVIKAEDKVLASTSYKITAVEEKQVGSIGKLTTDTQGVSIVSESIVFSKVEDMKNFTLKAVVKDRYGNDSNTVLTWTTTDKSVATVAPVSKSDTHSANVTVKGDGHTIITAIAKDATGVSAKVSLEIQDHSPRVDTNKASVNLAFDYDSSAGKTYAHNNGDAVEIVPVYQESINKVELRDQSGENVSSDLAIKLYDKYNYIIQPVSADTLKTGTYNCNIYVQTSAGNDYYYPIKISVIDKAPSVSIKMGTAPNLFFTDTKATVYFKASAVDLSNITEEDASNAVSIIWEDASDAVSNGFSESKPKYSASKKMYYVEMSQQTRLTITDGKLADANVVKGTFTVKLNGYKKEYKFENFTIKYSYKKPALVTKNASSSIVPSVGLYNSSFGIYDKTNKRYLYYGTSSAQSHNDYYNAITCDSEDIKITTENENSELLYNYSGTESSKKFNLTVSSPLWREALTASHTMKAVKPSAYLSYGTMTYNTNYKSVAYNYVYLKNASSANLQYSDIEIEGANDKAQKLLDDGLFVITTYNNELRIEQSPADLMGVSIPVGTYSYKVTPYYLNTATNENIALNTATFKLKVIDKPVTAKVSPKGSIDLIYEAYNTLETEDKNNIATLVDPKFSNMGTGYSITGCRLIGEYSDYFTLHDEAYIKYSNKYGYHYYITVNDSNNTRRLKAGQAYKLAIAYTITNGYGEEFTVTSNTFTIKPKQTAPKVTVLNNNQTLYASENSLSRIYGLSVPSSYKIESASGSIDCNKDGTADITVIGSSSLTVKINDRDAVGATAKGKTYSIPVTVQLVGRDGVAKDVKVTIKVKIRR